MVPQKLMSNWKSREHGWFSNPLQIYVELCGTFPDTVHHLVAPDEWKNLLEEGFRCART